MSKKKQLHNSPKTFKVKDQFWAKAWALFLPIVAMAMLNGCGFIGSAFKYKETTINFVESMIQEDYSACVGLMKMDADEDSPKSVDDIKIELKNFRNYIVTNWGEDLDYSFMRAEKRFSSSDHENANENTTLVWVQFQNSESFGALQVLFDDESKKILNINVTDKNILIPSMLFFWAFGIVALFIPAFNIYVIWKIKNSNLNKKWLKYCATIGLNVPAVTYAAIGGLSFNLLSFQLLLGASFGYMGYFGSYWTFGIPLGGLYCLWRIRKESISSADEAG